MDGERAHGFPTHEQMFRMMHEECGMGRDMEHGMGHGRDERDGFGGCGIHDRRGGECGAHGFPPHGPHGPMGMHMLCAMFMKRFAGHLGHMGHMGKFPNLCRGVFDPHGFMDGSFPVDVTEGEDDYFIEARIPGVKKEDIRLEQLEGMLLIVISEEGAVKNERPPGGEEHDEGWILASGVGKGMDYAFLDAFANAVMHIHGDGFGDKRVSRIRAHIQSLGRTKWQELVREHRFVGRPTSADGAVAMNVLFLFDCEALEAEIPPLIKKATKARPGGAKPEEVHLLELEKMLLDFPREYCSFAITGRTHDEKNGKMTVETTVRLDGSRMRELITTIDGILSNKYADACVEETASPRKARLRDVRNWRTNVSDQDYLSGGIDELPSAERDRQMAFVRDPKRQEMSLITRVDIGKKGGLHQKNYYLPKKDASFLNEIIFPYGQRWSLRVNLLDATGAIVMGDENQLPVPMKRFMLYPVLLWFDNHHHDKNIKDNYGADWPYLSPGTTEMTLLWEFDVTNEEAARVSDAEMHLSHGDSRWDDGPHRWVSKDIGMGGWDDIIEASPF